MKEYKRKTVCNAIIKLCECVIAVNQGKADLPYPQKINRLIVFGSLVNSNNETVHDGDIYIEIEENRAKWTEFTQKYGNPYDEYVKYIFTPSNKLNKYLNVSPSISIAEGKDCFEKIVCSDSHVILIENGKLLDATFDNVLKYVDATNGISKKKISETVVNISQCWKTTNLSHSLALSKEFEFNYNDEFEFDYFIDQVRKEVLKAIPERYLKKDFCTKIVLVDDSGDDAILQVNSTLADRVILVPEDYFEKEIKTKELFDFAKKKRAVGVNATIRGLCDILEQNDIEALVDLIIVANLYSINDWILYDLRKFYHCRYRKKYCLGWDNYTQKYLEDSIYAYAHDLLLKDKGYRDIDISIEYNELKAYIDSLYLEKPSVLAQCMVTAFDRMIKSKKIITVSCLQSYTEKYEMYMNNISNSKNQIENNVKLYELPFNTIKVRL